MTAEQHSKRSPVILACDIGGTQIKLGFVRGRKVLARFQLPSKPHEGVSSALARIASAMAPACQRLRLRQQDLAGFALSFPGIIEPGSQRVLSTPAGKFDDAKEVDLGKAVKRLLGLRLFVCNDANAALAAEWKLGAARGYRSAVMMTLGTGLGTSAIVDGIPLRGQHGQAGCLGGHFVGNLNGRQCLCGNRGCFESEASTWALPDQAQAHPDFRGSRISREPILDYAAIFRAAAKGDRLAAELRDSAIHTWSCALVSLIHAYDPEIAVLGGGIMRSGEIILRRIRRYVAQHAWTPWGKVTILPATLGNDAGMLGAAWLFESQQ